MVWITSIILIVGYILYKFFSDMKKESYKMSKVGGIKVKYKELIKYFDTFDTNKKPQIIEDKPNSYVIGWAGYSTISNISFQEINNYLFVDYKSQYNMLTLKREGVDIKKLPKLKKLEWKFDSEENQYFMIKVIEHDFNKMLND